MLKTLADWLYVSPFVTIYTLGCSMVAYSLYDSNPGTFRMPDWGRYLYVIHAQGVAIWLMIQLWVKADGSLDTFRDAMAEWNGLGVTGWLARGSTVVLFLTPLYAFYACFRIRQHSHQRARRVN